MINALLRIDPSAKTCAVDFHPITVETLLQRNLPPPYLSPHSRRLGHLAGLMSVASAM